MCGPPPRNRFNKAEFFFGYLSLTLGEKGLFDQPHCCLGSEAPPHHVMWEKVFGTNPLPSSVVGAHV